MRYIFAFLSILFISCTSKQQDQLTDYSFYHWKSKAKMDSNLESTLEGNPKKVYLHYFDVDFEEYRYEPKYVLTQVDDWYKNQNIVPVVYITNHTLKNIYSPEDLGRKIKDLVNEISTHHFSKTLPDLQIDCDWTERTKDKYFELLKLLKVDFNVSATIRLHQLKYPDKTGVPPVEHGTLMLYNMGDLTNMEQNSILETRIIESYIDKDLSYPFPLDLALPLFSQTVIKNYQGRVRLINHIPESLSDTSLFKPVKDNNYRPKLDTLFNGFFISPSYELKTEKVTEEDLVKSVKMLKNTKLDISSVIYYHLDKNCIDTYNLTHIRKSL